MTQVFNYLLPVIALLIVFFIGFFVSKESKRSLKVLNEKLQEFDKVHEKDSHKNHKRAARA